MILHCKVCLPWVSPGLTRALQAVQELQLMQPELKGVHSSFPVGGSQLRLMLLRPPQCWL